MTEKQFWREAFLSALSGASIISDNEGLSPQSLARDAADIADEALAMARRRGILGKETVLKTKA